MSCQGGLWARHFSIYNQNGNIMYIYGYPTDIVGKKLKAGYPA